jgi:radical SAM superfamily enzyme YgiQ (UPF0313 family)
MFSVLLISLHDIGTYGHRCVSSSLKRNGFLVNNVFFRSNSVYQEAAPVSEIELRALSDLAKLLRPNLIGINIHSSFGHPLAEKVTLSIKSKLDIPIIFGGVHPTVLPKFCLEHTKADYVCIGEGEESIIEFCQHMRAGQAVEVSGIISRATSHDSGRIPPQDLDCLPFQDIGNDNKYSILSNGTIIEGDPLLRGNNYPTKASRGCPFYCSYCSVPQLRYLCKSCAFYRLRSAERVIEEICQFIELNNKCTHVTFWDDTFPYAKSWIQEFSAQYKKKINIPFRIWLNPDTTKESNISLLQSAGLQSATIGIESASDKTRKKIFLRTENKNDIFQADRALSKYKIRKIYDFILDHPWESHTELEETFNLVAQLKKPFRLNMHSLILLPGTDLARRAIQEGLSNENDIIENIISDTHLSSRKMQWIRGIPFQESAKRSYWIFMILAAHIMSATLVKALANNKTLRKYPAILTNKEGIREWQVRDDIPEFLLSIYCKSKRLQRFFNKRPLIKKRMKSAILSIQEYLTVLSLIGYVIYRIVTRMPIAIFKTKIQSLT